MSPSVPEVIEPGMKQGVRLGKFQKRDLSRITMTELLSYSDRVARAKKALFQYYPAAEKLKITPYIRPTLTGDRTASGHMIVNKTLVPGWLKACLEAYKIIGTDELGFILIGVIDTGDKAWCDIPRRDALRMGIDNYQDKLWVRYEDLIHDPEELRKTLCMGLMVRE